MKKEKCPECDKGYLEIKKVPYFLYGKKIGNFPGEVCSKCNAEYFNEKQDEVIEKKVKQLGLFGLEAETKIRQSGSSLSITIPKRLKDFFHIEKGKEAVLIPVDEHTLKIRV